MTSVEQVSVVAFLEPYGTVLIIRKRSSPAIRWSLPKGTIEPSWDIFRTAWTETLEEAGCVIAPALTPIGSCDYSKPFAGQMTRFSVKVVVARIMEVRDTYREKNQRLRAFVEVADAQKCVMTPYNWMIHFAAKLRAAPE